MTGFILFGDIPPAMAGLSTPLGLIGLGALVPLVVLYLLQPDPRRLSVPTTEFLPNVEDEGGANPLLERLRRNLLLLIQIGALILLAVALGSPFIDVAKTEAADETVIVLDATASMAVEDGGETRFDRAVERAKDEVTGVTSVVVVGSATRVPTEKGTASEARSALDAVTRTDAPGSLASGVARGTAIAGENTRLVVLSDFSGTSDWQGSINQARAEGLGVEVRQIDGGGGDNVGIVGVSFRGEGMTVEVANFGEETATRDVSIGDASESLTLSPGDFTTATLPMPETTGTVELSPGDSFPTDDTLYVVGRGEEIDVKLVTSNENRFLTAALGSMSGVSYDVSSPPVDNFDGSEYDAVIFEEVNSDRLLDRTVRNARTTLSSGGGVVVVAQEGLGSLKPTYGDLLIVEPGEVAAGEGLNVVSEDRMVRGVDFPAPEEYVQAELRSGRTLVESGGGDPLIASDVVRGGNVLYYGFMLDSSEFHRSIQYPTFWRDAIHHISGRELISSMNRETGGTLSFANETAVSAPSGERVGTSVVMEESGFYSTGEVTYSANLLNPTESDLNSTPVEETSAGEAAEETQEETVPVDMTPHAAFAVLLLVASELAIMRFRGDI